MKTYEISEHDGGGKVLFHVDAPDYNFAATIATRRLYSGPAIFATRGTGDPGLSGIFVVYQYEKKLNGSNRLGQFHITAI